MHILHNISERLISIFVNLMILAVRIHMLLFFHLCTRGDRLSVN